MDKGYELRYFARKWKLTTAEAASLIRRHGTDRLKLNQAGAALMRSKQEAQRS